MSATTVTKKGIVTKNGIVMWPDRWGMDGKPSAYCNGSGLVTLKNGIPIKLNECYHTFNIPLNLFCVTILGSICFYVENIEVIPLIMFVFMYYLFCYWRKQKNPDRVYTFHETSGAQFHPYSSE